MRSSEISKATGHDGPDTSPETPVVQLRAYLAGAINGKSDAECRDWRETAKRLRPDVEWLDPMVRDYRGQEHRNVSQIVEGDKADIDSADVVLVMANAPSWGTAMEIMYAFGQKRVLAVVPGGCSPWLLYHADIYSTLEAACEAL